MPNKDANQIEKMAIAKLKQILLMCDSIDPYIYENDKTPSFDGQLFVYSGAKSKKNLVGTIDVQIKGTETVIREKTYKYQVEIADLINFRNDDGCVFFLVSVDFEQNDCKVYYEALQVLDLNRIIDKAKDQKTFGIELKEFPQNDPIEITNICINFLKDSKKQRSFIDNTPTLEELLSGGAPIDELVMSGTVQGVPTYDIDRYITTHSVYLYAKIKNLNVEIPVEKITNSVIKRSVTGSVKVKNRKYYDSYSVITEGGIRKYVVGKSLVLKTDKDFSRIDVNMCPKGNISDYIRDTEFFVDMIRSRTITLNGASVDLGAFDKDPAIFHAKLDYYKDVDSMLKKMGVTEDLDCSKVNDNDNNNIRNLVNSVLYGNRISFKDVDDSFAYGLFKIANLKIMIWIKRREDGSYDVSNFFDNHSIVYFKEEDVDKKNPIPVSQFLLLTEESLSESSNLDCKRIYQDIIEKGTDLDYVNMIQVFMLSVLNAYDLNIKHQDELLSLAQMLCAWISNIYTDDDLQSLNRLQIVKRSRDLNDAELLELNHIVDTTDESSVRCGAYILLDDYINAQRSFEELNEKQQEEFVTYPIYHFVLKNQQGGKK